MWRDVAGMGIMLLGVNHVIRLSQVVAGINFLGLLPCGLLTTGSQCSTGIFFVRKLALAIPRSRGGVCCPVLAPEAPPGECGCGAGSRPGGHWGAGSGERLGSLRVLRAESGGLDK